MIARQRGSVLLLFGAMLLATAASLAARAAADDPAAELIRRMGLEESATPSRDMPGWRKPARVLVLVPPDEVPGGVDPLAALREVAGGAELVKAEDAEDLLDEVADADVMLGLCTPELVAAGTKLRWIQHYNVGVDKCVGAPGLRQRQILLTNAQHLSGPQIAEHVLALMLSLSRKLGDFALAQQRGAWEQDLAEGIWELDGKTVLVVGLGGIGTEVASRVHALGMKVIATRNSSREGPDYVEYVGLANELNTLAERADVVVNCTPLTPQTTGIFNKEFFRHMKNSAVFISIGRGKSTVTADLVAALKEGELAGAGLDVVDPEPLPADSPLWKLPNVVITPHIAASSDIGSARVWTLLRENLRRYVAGERMLNVVDLDKGY